MYFKIFQSHAFPGWYHIIIGRTLNPPMVGAYHDFGTAEDIGQLMGGN